MSKTKRSLSTLVKPPDYGIEPEDSPFAQALAELVAMGIIEAKSVKFQGGKWRTLWGLTELGMELGPSCIDESIPDDKQSKQ